LAWNSHSPASYASTGIKSGRLLCHRRGKRGSADGKVIKGVRRMRDGITDGWLKGHGEVVKKWRRTSYTDYYDLSL
jgi:hypothetical protein